MISDGTYSITLGYFLFDVLTYGFLPVLFHIRTMVKQVNQLENYLIVMSQFGIVRRCLVVDKT
ncbi:hypothetical protein CsSME_00054070 [Camellia sinensis var. sinensis]